MYPIVLWPKGQCVCGGGGGGSAKAVRHDRNFCNFFDLNNFTVSYIA